MNSNISTTGMKRGYDDLVNILSSKNKKPRTSSTPSLNSMPQDIAETIFNFIGLKDLISLTLVSKRWTCLTAEAPFWKQLCYQAGLSKETSSRDTFVQALQGEHGKAQLASARYFSESKNILSLVNIQKALIECHGALASSQLSKRERFEADIRTIYLNTIKTVFRYEYSLYSYGRVAFYLKKVIGVASPNLSASAKILMAEVAMGQNASALILSNLFLELQKVNNDLLISAWVRAHAQLVMAEISCLSSDYSLALTDDQTFAFLSSVRKNAAAPLQIKIRADLMLAYRYVFKGCSRLTQGQAFALLQGVRQNPQVASHVSITAEYALAYMQFRSPIDQLTDEQAVALFQSILQNPGTGEKVRKLSQLMLVEMLVGKRTDQLTDEQAMVTLQSLSTEPKMANKKSRINFLQAKMQVCQRTDVLGDAQAVALLISLLNDETAKDYVVEVGLYLAKMHVENRTNAMPDGQICILLSEICQNSNAESCFRIDAHLLLVAMHLSNRNSMLLDPTALAILEGVLANKLASTTQHALASEYKNHLLNNLST